MCIEDEINYRVVLIHKDDVPLIRAESYIPLKKLDTDFKKELITSEAAIGIILKKQNVETRREILSVGIECGDKAKDIFKNSDSLLSRTYKIIRGGETLIWIKEIFSQIMSANADNPSYITT
jgi:chorismate-pyruvate lyase